MMNMPLHPIIVHFPIALFWVAGGLYVVSIWKKELSLDFPYILHGIATISSVIALISGLQAEPSNIISEEIESILKLHTIFAYVTVWGFALLWIWVYWRKHKIRSREHVLFSVIFLLMLIVMSWGAHQGARLVYQHGTGVQIQTQNE